MTTRKLQIFKLLFLWQLFFSVVLSAIGIYTLLMWHEMSFGSGAFIFLLVIGSFGLTYLFYRGSSSYKLSRRELIIVILTFLLIVTSGLCFLLSS